MPDIAYLHVGPHKTGSTALQQEFAINAHVLARYKIHYPEAGRKGAAHQLAARACRDRNTEVLSAVAAEVRSHQRVFLSSELIAGLDTQGMGLLLDAICADQVQIIYMLRRLPAHWASHWKELVKHGQSMDFASYLAMLDDPHAPLYNVPPQPTCQLARLAQVFGRDSLRLLIYEARRDVPSQYGPDFIDDVFGIGQDAALFTTCQLNRTAPDWQSELVRQLNCRAQDQMSYAQKWQMRRRLLDHLDTDPPDWLDDFQEAFDTSTPTVLSDQTPLIHAEQSTVIDKYGDLLVDPIEPYQQALEVAIHELAPDQHPALQRHIDTLFDALRTGSET